MNLPFKSDDGRAAPLNVFVHLAADKDVTRGARRGAPAPWSASTTRRPMATAGPSGWAAGSPIPARRRRAPRHDAAAGPAGRHRLRSAACVPPAPGPARGGCDLDAYGIAVSRGGGGPGLHPAPAPDPRAERVAVRPLAAPQPAPPAAVPAADPHGGRADGAFLGQPRRRPRPVPGQAGALRALRHPRRDDDRAGPAARPPAAHPRPGSDRHRDWACLAEALDALPDAEALILSGTAPRRCRRGARTCGSPGRAATGN